MMEIFHEQIVAQFHYFFGGVLDCMGHLPNFEEALLCALVCQVQNLLPQHSRIYFFNRERRCRKKQPHLFLGLFLYLGLMGYVT